MFLSHHSDSYRCTCMSQQALLPTIVYDCRELQMLLQGTNISDSDTSLIRYGLLSTFAPSCQTLYLCIAT